MNNHTWLALVAALLLAGCASTASEFECNATTSDRSDHGAGQRHGPHKTLRVRGKAGCRCALPALVELPAPCHPALEYRLR